MSTRVALKAVEGLASQTLCIANELRHHSTAQQSSTVHEERHANIAQSQSSQAILQDDQRYNRCVDVKLTCAQNSARQNEL